jgi:hypothetical protein
MPEVIAFFRKERKEDESTIFLKSITPYFYWCSAHEFKENKSKNKFLFQYQIYFIENKKIIPGEVIQKWYPKKNNIKIEIINFLNIWEDHGKILLNHKKPNDQNVDYRKNLIDNDFEYFSTFAHFVAKSIVELKEFYIQQSEEKELDLLQKKYWQNMSIYYEGLAQNYYNESITQKEIKKRPAKKVKKTNSKNVKKNIEK